MKKSVKGILIAACFIAGIALVFTGCAYPNTKVKGQDTSYAVFSNGGSAVQYGDYVYFINGSEESFDSAKENRWGEVVKGGIYRAKIENGAAVTEKDADNVEYKAYKQAGSAYLDINKVEVINFKEDEKKITMIAGESVERVVPKYVKSDNNAYAGIFIYDGWIYYSSPNTRKDKSGEVNYDLSDFFRTKVDGTGTQRLYSSKEAVTDYNFYHYNGKVYLVCCEGSDLISVPVGSGAGKTVRLSDGIGEVYFPRKAVYYKGINEDTAADYVYYVRALNSENDNSFQGNVFECRRPDLALNTSVQIGENNSTYGIAGVDVNTLFYYETKIVGATKILWAQPRFDLWSKGLISEAPGKEAIIVGIDDSIMQITPFNNNTESNGPAGYSAVGLIDSDLVLFQGKGVVRQGICTGVNSIVKIENGNTVYFMGSEALYSVRTDTKTAKQLTKGNCYLTPDFAADMIWFFGGSINQKDFDIELREEAIDTHYMFVKQVKLADKDSDEFFIGKVGPDELPEEEE